MSYNYAAFNGGRGYTYRHTREEYSTTPGGNFRSKPDSITTKTVDGNFFVNFVQAIPFFNHPSYGESCRASWNYTCAGYLPVRIVTSKRGYKKFVDTFTPIR